MSSRNYKILNYEIETGQKQAFAEAVISRNYKILNYEIETLWCNLYRWKMYESRNYKILNYEIETRLLGSRLSSWRK